MLNTCHSIWTLTQIGDQGPVITYIHTLGNRGFLRLSDSRKVTHLASGQGGLCPQDCPVLSQSSSLLPHCLCSVFKLLVDGAPGWLSQLSVRLRLRSWSRSLWVRAPRQALCWQLRAWSLFRILCFPLPLTLPCSCSLSQKWIHVEKKN